MASYALPSAISPPAGDGRRSFFLPDAHSHSVTEKAMPADNAHPSFPGEVKPATRHHIAAKTSLAQVYPAIDESMPQQRPRGQSDLGRTDLRSRTASTVYSSPRNSSNFENNNPNRVPEATIIRSVTVEIFTAITIPLPFLLGSIAIQSAAAVGDRSHLIETEGVTRTTGDASSAALSIPAQSSDLIQACTLASGTLILIGIIGRLAGRDDSRNRRKSQIGLEKANPASDGRQFSSKMFRRIGHRLALTTLPFLATADIGGVRTGAYLLASAAGGLLDSGSLIDERPASKSWKRALVRQTWTLMTFGLGFLCDLFIFTEAADTWSVVRGYVLLAGSMLSLQLPAPSISSPSRQDTSPLIKSREETSCTLAAGALLGFVTLIISMIFYGPSLLMSSSLTLSLSSITSAAGLLICSRPNSLRSRVKPGLIIGIVCCVCFNLYFSAATAAHCLALCALFALLYAAVQLDTKALGPSGSSSRSSIVHLSTVRHHDNHRHHLHSGSVVTRLLLQYTEDSPLLHSMLLDKESRRIIYFMAINLGFMFIQTFYAMAAGSLGLLSDSIHMLFDCVGLMAGLIASVMSKWPPNAQFPYGYGKVETLSGLGNGIFLMIISVEIIWESFERFVEGAELHRLTELLVVSVGGLAVNCLGLVFIGHHHHGHSHGHSHGQSPDQSHDHAYEEPHMAGNRQDFEVYLDGHKDAHGCLDHELLPKQGSIADREPQRNGSSEVHADQHAPPVHGHANENMAGIYLHILADTMGSVAVIASTLLTKYTGWSGWDPIASCVIAVLIIIASCPLVLGSARQLLLTVPNEVEYALRSTLQELSGVPGVAAYAVPRFWLDDAEPHTSAHEHHDSHGHNHDHNHDHGHHGHKSEKHECSHGARGPRLLGVIHIIAMHNADLEEVRVRVGEFLGTKNIDALVHVEREEQSRCWCGAAGGSAHARNRGTIAI